MDKQTYAVTLAEGVDQDFFVNTECNGLELFEKLEFINNLVLFKLTEEQAQSLSESSSVVAVELEPDAELEAEPEVFDKPDTRSGNFITKYYPWQQFTEYGVGDTAVSTRIDGSNFFGTQLHYQSDQLETSYDVGWFNGATTREPGSELPYVEDGNLNQTWGGEYVDVVAAEAGSPSATYNDQLNHPDFNDANGNSRFVPMDWSSVTSNSVSNINANNQVTNQVYFSSHALGVMSAAGGRNGGWAKNASLRVIYLGSSPSTAYNTVLAWHQSKPVNPNTGRRNATVVTGSWGWSNTPMRGCVYIDEIETIRKFETDGSSTDINRPSGGWGNDYTPFIDAGMIPRVVADQDDNNNPRWCIPYPAQTTQYSTWSTIFSNFVSNNIYHFASAGNHSMTFYKGNDPRSNTRIFREAGGTFVTFGSGSYMGWGSTSNALAANYLTSRHQGPAGVENTFTISACQHSRQNPLLDAYSARGPYVDFTGFGANTWTNSPAVPHLDAFKWGYFSGTSCAAPNVAGVAVVWIDWYYNKYGEYPTFNQLKSIMSSNADTTYLEGDSVVNWSNVPSPSLAFTTTRLSNWTYQEVYALPAGRGKNGGFSVTEQAGDPLRLAYIPREVLVDLGNPIRYGKPRAYGDRPSTGQGWPRRKKSYA